MTTILIVEDDTATNNLYASALRLEGFSVMQATSYQQAIHALQGIVPSVVLLDLSLGDSHGMAVVTYLREHAAFSGTQVVVISGSIRHREDLARVGITDYLLKPVLADALCQYIRSVVDVRGLTS
jgi:DNA-binding response OmpR family regulator